MNKNNINTLTQVYNALLTINTKGEDTISMAMCLQALYKLIIELNGEKEMEE